MSTDSTLLLNHEQVRQKIKRIAHEILENYYQEKELVFIGVVGQGKYLAQLVSDEMAAIEGPKIHLFEIEMDKKNPLKKEISLSASNKELAGKHVLLFDDVLNSGKTLMHAASAILNFDVKTLHTVVLVNRKHRKFPIRADFMGMEVATTLQEHIDVEITQNTFQVSMR